MDLWVTFKPSILKRCIVFSSLRGFSLTSFCAMAAANRPEQCCESKDVSLELINKPLTFPVAENVVAKNRIIKAPMKEQLATFDPHNPTKSGLPTQALLNMYRRFAEGGSGINVTGCIVVSDNSITSAGDAIISKKHDCMERRELYRNLALSAVNNSLIIGQVVHPGKQVLKLSDHTYVPFDPNTATVPEIHQVLEEHVYAAQYLYEAGFHGIELNLSLNFTLGHMINADMNNREDDYGGPLKNRARLILEIIKGIRNALEDDKNFIIGLKLSSPNFEPKFNENEYEALCQRFDRSKLDYVSVTGGHYKFLERLLTDMTDSSKKREAFYVRFAELTRKYLKKVRVIRCGGFINVEQINEVLISDSADAVAIGRPIAAEPDLPNKLLEGIVKSAKKTLFSELDYFKRKNAAGTQLWQIANDLPLLDLTNEHHVKAYEQALVEHYQTPVLKSTDTDRFGYPKLNV